MLPHARCRPLGGSGPKALGLQERQLYVQTFISTFRHRYVKKAIVNPLGELLDEFVVAEASKGLLDLLIVDVWYSPATDDCCDTGNEGTTVALERRREKAADAE